MMEVKKSEYLHMKMERKNGGDKKEIYTYKTFYNCPQIRTVRLPERVDKIAPRLLSVAKSCRMRTSRQNCRTLGMMYFSSVAGNSLYIEKKVGGYCHLSLLKDN